MNAFIKVLVPNKSRTVGKCSRIVLIILIFSCVLFLLVENDAMERLYMVNTYRTFNFTAAHGFISALKNTTALRLVKELQNIQILDDVTVFRNSTNFSDIEMTFNAPMNLNVSNTVLLVAWNKTQSKNSIIDMQSASNHNMPESLFFYPPDPFEINYSWEKRRKGHLDIYILSAIGVNSKATKGYQAEVKLNGWLALKHKFVQIKCCILWNSNRILEYYSPVRTHQKKQISLLGTQIACPIKGSLHDVKGVTLQFAQKECTKDKSKYLRPLITPKPTIKDSFAVCLKILFGNIDDKSLIYWIEYYREMKVDRIFTFTYNITKSTLEILKHYNSLGLLDWREFDYPWKGGHDVGNKVPIFWEDEQVVIYDCFSRLHGYKYFSIIDLDEYLLPRKHENFKDLMKYLVTKYPNVAGFQMKSYIFNKHWIPSGSQYGPDVVRYIKRTHAFSGGIARPKNILLPTRIKFNSEFHTHKFMPKEGYKSVIVDESVASINHYRECYYGLKHACNRGRAVTDRDILKYVERIKDRTEWFPDSRENGRS